MHGGRLSPWLRSFLQPVTYLGAVMAACVVAGAIYLADKDYKDNYDIAVRSGANLARVFEGYISRTMKSADNSLRFLRNSYQQNPEGFDIAAWSRNFDVQNDLMLQLTITGADGIIKASTFGSSLRGNYIGDREHFRVHVNSRSDELFISKPVLLRTRGKWAIVLSRRLVAHDGSFAGVISAAIDPLELDRFYSSLDLGDGGIASLIGFDGVLRARGGHGQLHNDFIGRSFVKTQALSLYNNAPTGHYWNTPGTFETVKRLITYRVVEGFPLIAVVGLSEADIFAEATENAHIYYGVGIALLAAIMTAIGFGAARECKLGSITSSLARTNARFETALANMPHGLCMFDDEQKLIVRNDLYGKMYKIPPELMRYGTPFQSIIDASIKAGNFFDNATEYAARLRDEKARRSAADYISRNTHHRNDLLRSIAGRCRTAGGLPFIRTSPRKSAPRRRSGISRTMTA